MKVFSLTLLTLATCATAKIVPLCSPKPHPRILSVEQDLIDFATTSALQLFPNHTDWQVSYDKYFDPTLKATFATPVLPAPETVYDITTFKLLWTAVNAQIVATFKSLEIKIVDAVAFPFPNDPKSGYVYLTGLEQGVLLNGSQTAAYRDGLFAVIKSVNGTRRFTECGEATNLRAA